MLEEEALGFDSAGLSACLLEFFDEDTCGSASTIRSDDNNILTRRGKSVKHKHFTKPYIVKITNKHIWLPWLGPVEIL